MTNKWQELRSIIKDITLPSGWTLLIQDAGYDQPYLQISDQKGTCNVTGEPLTWKGRKWRLSWHMTKSEVVQTALMATLAAVEHETREQFLYKGQPIFDPHYDVEDLHLLRAANMLDARNT